MNYVKIEYSYISSKAKISINGEKISSFSDMASLMNRPFYEIENSIMAVLDKEIFDNYEINLQGMTYQYEVLKYYQKESEYCVNINFTELKMDTEREWYCAYVQELAEKYHLQTLSAGLVKVYILPEKVLPEFEGEISICSPEDAGLGVYVNQEEAQKAPMEHTVVLCNKYDFAAAGNKKIFYLPEEGLSAFIDYYRKYCLELPLFEKNIDNLKYRKLDEKDKIGLNACLSGKPAFYFGELPEIMESGQETEFQFKSFPEGAFFVRSKDEEILVYRNSVLSAEKSGTGFIEVVNTEGEVAETRAITVVQHNYVKEIRVISEISFLNINDRSKVEILPIPADAEDAVSLKWEIENQSIAHVSKEGEIIALSAGKTKLRISGVKAVKELDIEVKPIVKELRFRNSLIRMKPGETVIVECDVIPSNASCENLKWSFDNEIIASFSPSYDGKKCKLQAKKEHSGKGNLKCVDQKQQVSAVCNVEVTKLKTAGGLAGFAIASLVLGLFCMPFFTPLSIILSIIGLSSSEAEGEKKTFKTCLIIGGIEAAIVILLLLISAFQ